MAAPVALIGEALVSSQSVQLTFSGALDENSAGDESHYSVAVNGVVVHLAGALYDAKTNTVTLFLPEGALREGDKVSVAWHALPARGTMAISAR